jgi:hypothetical protein
LEILHVWRLKAFEGDTLAATGSIGLEGERLEAEVSEIFDEEWALALANGSISQEERDELSGRPMLDGTYAKLCARI